jgi:hypothetical protein
MLSVGTHVSEAALEASLVYLGVAGAGVVLASLGRRALFAVPTLTLVGYGVVFGFGHLPQPIGTQWTFQCASGCAAWYSNAWIGAGVDLLLVLIPGAVVAATVPRKRWPERVDASTIAAMGIALAATIIAYRTTVIVNGSGDLSGTITVASFALLAGTARRWWPWTHVLLALALSGGGMVLAWNAMFPDAGIDIAHYLWESAAPLVVVALIVASWQPMASILRKAKSRPLGLFVVANLLNVADAVLTMAAVGAGKAVEMNPIVRWMGMPAKIVLVAGLTWILYRRRASGLIWTVAVLFSVLCYHLSGLVVNR